MKTTLSLLKKHVRTIVLLGVLALATGALYILLNQEVESRDSLQKYTMPDALWQRYVELLNGQQYEEMYEMLDEGSRETVAKDAFVKRHPAGVMIALLCFLLLMVLQSCMGAAFTLGNSLGGAIGGTSYLAEDGEINSAELAYTEWETDLTIEAENAESTHGGYDEYRYDIDQTGHDPYAMLAYLTARYDDFTFAAVQGELQSIFAEQYTLTFTESVEVRYRTETVSDSWTDPVTGESYSDSYEIEVPYNWYVLTVTLTARPFEDVISPRLTTQDEQDRYEVYMFLHGNRQYVGSPFDFVWTPYVSSYYGYRVHPISGEKDYHTGADVALPEGTEILAGGDGVVVAAGTNGGYGLAVLVDYGEGITARYAHTSKSTPKH